MLAFDCVLYGLLAVYLDHVIPGEYGPRYGWFFFVDPSYWSPANVKQGRVNDQQGGKNQNELDFERMPPEAQGNIAIVFDNIRKVFTKKNDDFVAVDDISMNIYKGEITAILGHNGAGKTTLVNMLVGTLPPTSGTATVFGYDISQNADVFTIRSKLGVCLQQDIILDDLSAVDHLQFFAELKGMPQSQVPDQVSWLFISPILNQANINLLFRLTN